MDLKTQKQIRELLNRDKKFINKETFRKLLIDMCELCEKELKLNHDDELHTLDYIYNLSRVFLKKHFNETYKEDDDFLDEFTSAPDVIFGFKDDTIRRKYKVYEAYIKDETQGVEEQYKFEISLIKNTSSFVGDTAIVCYTEYFEGTKEQANQRGKELKKEFDCEIARVEKIRQ